MGFDSHHSEALHSTKSNARTFDFLEHEEDEDTYYDDEKDGHDVKKFSNPRKQVFTTTKSSYAVQNPDKASKDEDHSDGHSSDKDYEKPKSSAKKKERQRKKSANLTAHPKTPTSNADLQKKNLDTPSPEKQSLSGGRSRRNVRPFSHINPDEYELGK